MGLWGECKWCDRTANLRFQPGGNESRPTICDECYHRAEELMHE